MVKAPDNPSRSDRDDGQGGGAVGRMPPNDEPGNEQGRFEWTDRLRDDLYDSYQESEPTRRGYMARMYSYWCQKHPEHQNISSQRLRDYMAYLRRSGYVRTPHEQPEAVVQQMDHPIEHIQVPHEQPEVEVQQIDHPVEHIPLNNDIGLHERTTKIRGKVYIKPQHLANANERLRNELPEDVSIEILNNVVYRFASELMPNQPHGDADNRIKKNEKRVEQVSRKIQEARQQASRIQCVIEYITTRRPFTTKVKKIAQKLRHTHHTLTKDSLNTIKQHCLERIRALVVVKKRLTKRIKSVADNRVFLTQPSRLLEEETPKVDTPPSVEQVTTFWRNIYETKKPLNVDTPALDRFGTYCLQVQQQNEGNHEITKEEVANAIKGTKSFAAPGPDAINNFWWKKFPSTHEHLARIFNTWLNERQPIPKWFVEGRTVLIPKKGDLTNPKNYRPITCLNTCYKIFTRIIYNRLLSTIEPVLQDIREQRGGKKGSEGCKENLLIDRCITQDSVQYKRNLSMTWIDYKKAFDTTSHELILHLLERLKVAPTLINCIERLMPLWKTKFTITSGTRKVETELVTFRRGVFQGDSLSPLLFCISLLPLSVALRQTRGYNCGPPGDRRHKVTHLFYMDDLKLYAASERDLRQSLRVVEEYTRDIGMEFGLDKCAVVQLDRGRYHEHPENMQLSDGNILRHLDAGETYNYLGIAQHRMQDTATIKSELRTKYRKRLKKIWSSELTGRNKVAATNMMAVPVLLYSFGVVKWTKEELRDLDVSTRKIMHMNRSLHPRSSVPRIYLLRHQGGRGLLSLECLHNRIVVGLACKVAKSSDALLEFVCCHERRGVGAFLFRAAEDAAQKLGMAVNFSDVIEQQNDDASIIHLEPSRLRTVIKIEEQRQLYRQHTERPQHGVFYRNIDSLQLSKKLTFSFLQSASLKSETEGFLLACQDGVINTLVYRSQFIQLADTKCRACNNQPETLMHLLSACPVHAISSYIHRHNAALRVLYYHLRHACGIDDVPILPYLPGDIESIVENDRCRIYWNFAFSTTRRLQANKPDIVLLDKTAKKIYVIEFSAPAETNIAIKEEEKRSKYKDLNYELRALFPRHPVTMVVLVIGVLGGIKDTFLKDLKKIPACCPSADSLTMKMQRAVILGSLRLLRQMNLVDGH